MPNAEERVRYRQPSQNAERLSELPHMDYRRAAQHAALPPHTAGAHQPHADAKDLACEASHRLVTASQSVPLAAASPRALPDAAMAERFRYWSGHSGRRYLFSAVDAADAADLVGAVVLVARDDDGMSRAHVGQGLPDPPIAGRVFVHLRADTDAARAEVIADLTGEPL